VRILDRIRDLGRKLEILSTLDVSINRVNLEVLDISYNDIEYREDVFKKLKDALSFSSLTDLNVSHNPIGYYSAKYFGSALNGTSRLETLNLSHCEISAGGAYAILEGLKRNVCLQNLDLSYNDLRGGALLSKKWHEMFKANKTLLTLKLDGSFIGNDAVLQITKGLVCHPKITKLSLRLCGAEDSSI
jgi:Ran GTPase-activating protein (RanGAP) involved in mRNA processing and transport